MPHSTFYEYLQLLFVERIDKNYPSIIIKYPPFITVGYSVGLGVFLLDFQSWLSPIELMFTVLWLDYF